MVRVVRVYVCVFTSEKLNQGWKVRRVSRCEAAFLGARLTKALVYVDGFYQV